MIQSMCFTATKYDQAQTPELHQITVFVDASAWGYGAVVRDKNGVRYISQPWSDFDRLTAEAEGGSLSSSVTAEPLAVRRIICLLSDAKDSHITIFSDHQGLVLAGQSRRLTCTSYEGMGGLVVFFCW